VTLAPAGGLSWNQLNETEVDVDANDGLQGLRFDTMFVRVQAYMSGCGSCYNLL